MPAFLDRVMLLSQGRLARFLPYAVALLVLCALFLAADEFWLKNDDAMMAMIVHGYGIADTPSPGMVYSNVIWGWLLEHAVAIGGIQPYTLASYFALALSLAGLIWALYRTRAPAWLGAAILIAAYAPVLLRMEFTLTAGYLAAAGIALGYAAASGASRGPWIFSGFLLVLAGWIRPMELLFVLGVSFPLYAGRLRSIRSRPDHKRFVVLLASTAGALLVSQLVNSVYYADGSWQWFDSMSMIRRQFIDYGLWKPFELHPEILAGSPITLNDIELIRHRFYLDPSVFNADNFRPLIAKVSLIERLSLNLQALPGLVAHFRPGQIQFFLGVLALLIALSPRRWSLLTGSALLAGAMLLVLALGRASAPYIYPPAYLALLAFGVVDWGAEARPRWRYGMMVVGMLSCLFAVLLTRPLYSHSLVDTRQMRVAREEICSLPKDRFSVIWGVGDEFSYSYIYRPFSPVGGECGLQFYPVGALELAAPVLAQFTHVTGKGDLVQALLAGQSFYMFTAGERIDLLQTFFREHYAMKLSASLVSKGRTYTLYELRVAAPGSSKG